MKDGKLGLDQAQALALAVADSARFFTHELPLENVDYLFGVLTQNTDFDFKSQTSFAAGQFIPLSALLRWGNRILDNVYRKPQGWKESFMKDLPTLSDELEPYRTPGGEESTRQWTEIYLPWQIGIVGEKYRKLYEERKKKRILKDQKKKALLKKSSRATSKARSVTYP